MVCGTLTKVSFTKELLLDAEVAIHVKPYCLILVVCFLGIMEVGVEHHCGSL